MEASLGETCDAGASFDLGVEGFAHVGSAQAAADIFREGKNGEAFGNGALHPTGEFGSGGGVSFDGLVEAGVGFRAVAGVEDVTDVVGDLLSHGDFWNVGLGVLLEMELAALPGRGIESGSESGFEAFMGIGCDEVGDADAAFAQRGEECAPVNLVFGKGGGSSKDHAFAIVAPDADGDEDGAVAHGGIDAHLDVGGVEEEVGDFRQWTVAPFFKGFIEFCGESGDLSGCDFHAAEFSHDMLDATGGDSLEIHFGDCAFEGLVNAGAFFQEGRVKGFGRLSGLRDFEIHLAEGAFEGPILKSVGVAVSVFAALVGLGGEMDSSLHEHGGVENHFSNSGKPIFVSFVQKKLDQVIKGCIFGFCVFGHGWCSV